MTKLAGFPRTATNLAAAIRKGELSMREVADYYADRTDRYAVELNSHLYFDRADIAALQAVLRQVREHDHGIQDGERHALFLRVGCDETGRCCSSQCSPDASRAAT